MCFGIFDSFTLEKRVISIQIIDKSIGKYKVHKTIGSSSDSIEIEELVEQAKRYIKSFGGQTSIDFILGDDQRYFQSIYENIQQVQLLGPGNHSW